jgi:hypothetical protein
VANLAYKLTSTTSWVAVPVWDTAGRRVAISIENQTDGDVELAFQNHSNGPAEIICPIDREKVLDNFFIVGQAYIRNSTGTGGTVYLHVWDQGELRS